MKHRLTFRTEYRNGMREPEIRIICDCGFVDKARTEQDARVVEEKHLRKVGQLK